MPNYIIVRGRCVYQEKKEHIYYSTGDQEMKKKMRKRRKNKVKSVPYGTEINVKRKECLQRKDVSLGGRKGKYVGDKFDVELRNTKHII